MKTYRSFIEDVDFVLENINLVDPAELTYIERGLAALRAGKERRELRKARASIAQQKNTERSSALFSAARASQRPIRNKGWQS